MTKDEWEDLSHYFESGYDADTIKDKYDSIIKRIEENNNGKIISEFMETGQICDDTIRSFTLNNSKNEYF